MNAQIIPHKKSTESKWKQVVKIFTKISGNYDLLSRVITSGMDKR